MTSDSKETSRLPLNRYGVSPHRDCLQTTLPSKDVEVECSEKRCPKHSPTHFSTGSKVTNFVRRSRRERSASPDENEDDHQHRMKTTRFNFMPLLKCIKSSGSW